LANNFIRCLQEDSSGNLWFGTDYGLSRYNGKTFISYFEKQGLKNATVNDLCLDKAGKLWVATEQGIFLYEKDHFEDISTTYQVATKKVLSLYCDSTGKMWAGTQYGVYCFVPHGAGYQIRHVSTENGLPSNDITDLVGDEKGMWISTYGGGICHYDGQRFLTLGTKNGLLRNSVYCLYYAGNQKLWIGSSAGVTVLHYPTWDVDSVSCRYYTEDNGLCNNVTKCFLKDSFGNMWVGSSGGGISRLDSERFLYFPPEKDVLGELVFSIVKRGNGEVWLASSEGGISVFDGKAFRHIGQKEGFTSSKVKCMYASTDGSIWLGTTGNGAYCYNGHTFRHVTPKEGLSSLYINAIAQDQQGRIWFATVGAGACYFDPVKQRFQTIKPSYLGTDRVNTVFVDMSNTVWLGTLKAGIIKIPPFETGEMPRIQRFPQPSNGASPDNIRCITQAKYGQLLFGTAGKGILVSDGRTFVKLRNSKTLPSQNVYFLHCDKRGDIWVGSDKGVSRFSFQKDEIPMNVHTYARSSGFRGIETTHNGVYEDDQGGLWLGSISGVSRYDPSKDKEESVAPYLELTGMNLFFAPIQTTPFAKEVSPWYPVPSSLQLPYNQNSLSFQFLGIQLREPEAVQYSWKLEGFDQDWSPAQTKNEAVYSNLPPGNFHFLVRSRNQEGAWTAVPSHFDFSIAPPFWATWWFRLLFLGIGMGSMVGFYLYRIKAIKKKGEQDRFRLETEKSLLELEQKALHLQMNPHFLFNCLNSIKGLISENKLEESKVYLSRFARLMRSILDSSRGSHILLSQEIELLQQYVQLEKLSREDTFQLEIALENIPYPEALLIPSMLLQPFVENAILHGLAPKKEGSIQLTFRKEAKFIHCSIQDDGIGREEAAHRSNSSLDKHASVAIEVITERLKLLTKVEGAVQLIDLKTEEGKAMGTRVDLLLPYLEEI
jgi:ligand-binding sensor domain-containing protein